MGASVAAFVSRKTREQSDVAVAIWYGALQLVVDNRDKGVE